MQGNDEIFYTLASKKIRIYSVFLSSRPLLSKYLHKKKKKAAHGLIAPCDSSLSSVSDLAWAQLNPQPVRIMGQLDWPSLTCSRPFVMGLRACYGGEVYKGKGGKRNLWGQDKSCGNWEVVPFFLQLLSVRCRVFSLRGQEVKLGTALIRSQAYYELLNVRTRAVQYSHSRKSSKSSWYTLLVSAAICKTGRILFLFS